MIQIFTVACACLIVAGCATQPGASTSASSSSNSGHLLVHRAAKFGYRVNLVLSVDGKNVASLTEGQRYEGYLAAGQHVLGARVTGSTTTVHPTQKTITMEAGQTYSYTATLSGGHLALVKKR